MVIPPAGMIHPQISTDSTSVHKPAGAIDPSMPALARVLQFPVETFSMRKPRQHFGLTPPESGPPDSRKPRKPRRERKPPVSLSDAQLLALLETAKRHRERDYVMILVTYWHGLRANETVNLEESDFDVNEGTVRIVRGKGSEGGLHDLQAFPDNPLLDELAAVTAWLTNRGQFGVKGGAKPGRQRGTSHYCDNAVSQPEGPKARAKRQQSTQIVAFLPAETKTSHFPPGFEENPAAGPEPLLDPSALAGEAAIDRALPSRLFPVHRCHFWKLVHRYALEAGIPKRKCKTHMLKHTIAKHLVRAGHPLNEIQEWMGWSTIETMNWYTRADEEELGHRIGNTIRSKAGLRQVQQGSLFP
jgi:integrase